MIDLIRVIAGLFVALSIIVLRERFKMNLEEEIIEILIDLFILFAVLIAFVYSKTEIRRIKIFIHNIEYYILLIKYKLLKNKRKKK